MERGRKAEHNGPNGDMTLLARRFAAAECFRSATVEELEIENDFCRRPLRPEDLKTIDFAVPVTADTMFDLPSLASQRILRCIYDMQLARLPRSHDRKILERHGEFYSADARAVALRLAPDLEHFAFGFLEQSYREIGDLSNCTLQTQFEGFASETSSFARTMCSRFIHGDFSKADLRFVFVQKWCLHAANCAAITRAQASGYFDPLPTSDWPRKGSDHEENEALECLAIAADANREPHAFWQFYLPTSLAEANYLSALATRPDVSLAVVGASFVEEIEWQNFVWMVRQTYQDMGIGGPTNLPVGDSGRAAAEITSRFGRALGAVESASGTCGLEQLFCGFHAMASLARLAHLDLEKQLRWLASLDDYSEIARRVDQRIRVERPNIDRETFVEPREMCSTTHVHNDHRLVVIESGDMVFWGRPGMRFRMVPGDMILVPRGRLHGSSVESEQCTYHQPIIPEEWVHPLIGEIDQRHGWPTDYLGHQKAVGQS